MPGKQTTVNEIIPVELALVKFTDENYKNSMMLVAIASNLVELKADDPTLVGSIKVIDWLMPDGKWRNTGGVSTWLAKGIRELLIKDSRDAISSDEDKVESV